MDTFGDKLRLARERKGFSQTEVFKRTKINNKTLSRYEKGGSEPDYDTLKILAALYEVNIEDLIGVVEKNASIEETEAEAKRRKGRELLERIKDENLEHTLFLLEQLNKE